MHLPKSLDDFACSVFPTCSQFHSVSVKVGAARASAIRDAIDDAYLIAKAMRAKSAQVMHEEAVEASTRTRQLGDVHGLAELQRPSE
jgi:hypothetical protein